MRKVVEIRIHGVGGAPASDTLDDPHPRLVSGDDVSGFWRSREPRPRPAWPEWTREAMAWGGNTSGTWRHALWVLLLPYALINLAGWMHSPRRKPSPSVRLFGLTVTLIVVLLTAVTAFDVIAVQCGRDPACYASHRWLTPLGWQTLGGGGSVFLGHPERRLALLSLLPLAVIFLLWFAGRQGYDDLEAYDPWPDNPPTAKEDIDLRSPDFWRGEEPAYRARLLHVAAGRALLAGTLAWSVAHLMSAVPVYLYVLIGLSAVVLVLAAVATANPTTYQRCPNGTLRSRFVLVQAASWAILGAAAGVAANVSLPDLFTVPLVAAGLVGVAFILRAAQAAKKASPSPGRVGAMGLATGVAFALAAPGDLVVRQVTFRQLGSKGTLLAGLYPAPYQVLFGLLAGAVLLLVVLAIHPTKRPLRDHAGNDDIRTPFGGRGALVLAGLSLLMVLAVGAGIHLRVVQLLGTAVNCWDIQAPVCPGDRLPPETARLMPVGSEPRQFSIGFPWWYETVALAVVGLMARSGWVVWRYHRRLTRKPKDQTEQARLRDEVVRDLMLDPVIRNRVPVDSGAADPRVIRRLDNILQMRRMAPELLRADCALWKLAAFGAGVLLTLLIVQMPQTPWAGACRAGALGCPAGRSFAVVATAALWVVGLLPIAAIASLRYLSSDQGLRRQVGRLWDVVTFWPRHVHPFAPPAYGERVVPQLRLHIDTLLRQGNAVVVGGHSQGSILAAAALVSNAPGMQKDQQRERVALITYGSPIGILYERYFPAYFGPEFFDQLGRNVALWHNMYARTDIFAYNIFSKEWCGQPGSPCPVCGYGSARYLGRRTTLGDFVVIDPERWAYEHGEPPPPPVLGHSTYHTNRNHGFEAHVAVMVDHLRQDAVR